MSPTPAPTFFRRRLLVALVFCAAGSSGFSQLPSVKQDSYENFDLRDRADAPEKTSADTKGPGSAPVSRSPVEAATVRAMENARAELAARVPGLRVEMNRAATTPQAIGVEDAAAFLTPASSAAPETIVRQFLEGHAALYGLTEAQAKQLVKVAGYTNPAGNLSWEEFRQEFGGIPVFQGELRAALTRDGAIARTTGNLATGLDEKSLPRKAQLTPAQAATKAAAAIGYTVDAATLTTKSTEENGRIVNLAPGPFVREIKTELVYFPLAVGNAVLAYSMVLWEDVHAYYTLVDANTGALLWRKDITNFQTQPATYSVYTTDNPAPSSPTTALPGSNFQAPAIARSTVTLIGNEPPNTFNNLGWITDGINVTTGNNVNCGLDIAAPNGIDAGGQATGSPNRVFNFSYNPAPGPDSPTLPAFRSGATTNLFYWTNVYHDRLYLLGFTEPARNFQTSNFGRNPGGGTANAIAGNDAVLAEVQDSGGTNNANFSTPADGSAGRMQMYLFTSPTPARDGSLDAEVFIHELSHGLSNRLHNNGAGLTTTQAGGMGEGWGDFYGRCILSTADEDVNAVFSSGAYVTYALTPTFLDNYYYGIRRFPYVVKSNLGSNGKPHNPMTFGDIDFLLINALNDGAYPPTTLVGITANEVHNIGDVWCMMLLEVRARIITRLGWAVGNERAMQIVTDAMKLDVASPTIVQARDSIIAADNAGFAGIDVPDIRSGFAARGVGAGASVTGTTTMTVTESFYPSSAAGAITFSDSLGNNNGVAEPGEDLVVTIPLINRLSAADNNVNASLNGYAASYGNIPVTATTSRTFNYHVPATACGTTLQIPFVVTSDNGTANVTIPLQVGQPTTTASFSENFDSVVAPALPGTWSSSNTGAAAAAWKTAVTPVVDVGNCAFVADTGAVADSALISPVIPIGAGSQQLSYKQRYTNELPYDGGVLEISIAGGGFTDIQTAGGFFVQGGYGASITGAATGSPIIGRRAWSGTIPVTSQVIVNLPASAANQNVQFRWRFGSDNSTGSTGWSIDTVQVSSTSYACSSIDTDADGIPDGYETANGLNPANNADAALDSDGDGESNLEEYIAGTNPQSASSALLITSETKDATGKITIAFQSVNGRHYEIQSNPTLTNPGGWSTLLTYSDVLGTGGILSVIDTSSPGQPKRFYRVRALPL